MSEQITVTITNSEQKSATVVIDKDLYDELRKMNINPLSETITVLEKLES